MIHPSSFMGINSNGDQAWAPEVSRALQAGHVLAGSKASRISTKRGDGGFLNVIHFPRPKQWRKTLEDGAHGFHPSLQNLWMVPPLASLVPLPLSVLVVPLALVMGMEEINAWQPSILLGFSHQSFKLLFQAPTHESTGSLWSCWVYKLTWQWIFFKKKFLYNI